jgi:hypothetical protein
VAAENHATKNSVIVFSPNMIRMINSGMIKWQEYLACMGGRVRKSSYISIRTSEGKRWLVTPNSIQEDNIEMDLIEMRRIPLAQDRDQRNTQCETYISAHCR